MSLLLMTPLRDNYMISQYKQLHSSLSHLTWQTQQIANGDLNQKITFLGELSVSYNKLIESLQGMKQLEERLRLATNAGENWHLGLGYYKITYYYGMTACTTCMVFVREISKRRTMPGAKHCIPMTASLQKVKFKPAIRGEREYAPEFRIIHGGWIC